MNDWIRRIAPVDPSTPCQSETETLSPELLRVTVRLTCAGTDDACVAVEPGFDADFHWIGHLTPEDGYVADMHAFRAPAVILGSGGRYLCLVPDLNSGLFSHPQARAYLDLDAPNGRMCIGLSQTEVVDHILYKKVPGAALSGEIILSFFLLFASDQPNPWRAVLSFLWTGWGKVAFAAGLPTTTDVSKYIDHTCRWAFESWKDVVWQEFELDGKTVGAPVFIVTTTQSPNYGGAKKERELRSIWNQAWFCSMRSASGLFRYATRKGRADLLALAQKTKELALSFPMVQGGLFYGVIATEMETYEQDGKRFMRSLGWQTRYFGNSDRNPLGACVKDAPFHLLDMSFTAYYMLVWYDELEKDERLLKYARTYADKLLSLQDADGFYPAWVEGDGNVVDVLRQSPETSMSVVFLLYLAKLTGEDAYRQSALRALEAVGREVVPSGRWEDFETYWSCSHYWNDRVGEKVRRNDLYKQCNFSMFYTAWAALEAYEATGEARYLAAGQRTLDEMLMTQAAWQPPYMAIPVLGGFSVLNADAEWNDARQSLFAELILRYGHALGSEEYLQRGKAALRASFVMMYCPENPDMKRQWENAWPFLGEADYGFSMENYGHNGRTDSQGMGVGEFTIYDWGNGAAMEAAERIYAHMGAEYAGYAE